MFLFDHILEPPAWQLPSQALRTQKNLQQLPGSLFSDIKLAGMPEGRVLNSFNTKNPIKMKLYSDEAFCQLQSSLNQTQPDSVQFFEWTQSN